MESNSLGNTTPNRKPDIVVGCITDYDYAKIEPWVVSLERSGFRGAKVMMCYNVGVATLEKLRSKGFSIAAHNYDQAGNAFYKLPRAIVVQRFLDLWKLSRLNGWADQYTNIITTDVKDVIFQRNPSEFLSENLGTTGKTICVGCESLKYSQEPWGNENMFFSFGQDIYAEMKEKLIYNCGTISGRVDVMTDLFLNIYLLSCNAPIHNADQAALNVILTMKPWADQTLFNDVYSGYACQAGTTNDPAKIDAFRPLLTEPIQPNLDPSDNLVKIRGKVFYLVHQYDRIPKWKFELEKKYRE